MLPPMLVLLLGVAALLYAWKSSGAQEKFQPEMLDRTQAKLTQEVEHSSHEQRTNHMPFMSFVEAAAGVSTPFRVNAYTAVR